MPKLGKNIQMEYVEYIVWLVKRNKQIDLMTIANRLGVTLSYLKYHIIPALDYHQLSDCIERVKEAKKRVEYLVWICEEGGTSENVK